MKSFLISLVILLAGAMSCEAQWRTYSIYRPGQPVMLGSSWTTGRYTTYSFYPAGRPAVLGSGWTWGGQSNYQFSNGVRVNVMQPLVRPLFPARRYGR